MVVSVHQNRDRSPVLTKFRERFGLSQAQLADSFDILAEMLGCEERMACQQTISRIEKGEREITLKEAMIFAVLLGVRSDELFPGLSDRIVAIARFNDPHLLREVGEWGEITSP